MRGRDPPHAGRHHRPREVLNWLLENNFFIIPLADGSDWYRLHRLLKDVLQQRARKTYGETVVADWHRRAANWYFENGFIDEALHHATVIGDLELAAHLVESGFREALNREDRATPERWLHLFPDSFIAQRAGLLVIKAAVLQFGWRLQDIARVLDQYEALIEANPDAPSAIPQPILRGLILTLRAQIAYVRNQTDLCLSHAREALELLPAPWTYARGGAMVYVAMASQALGQASAINALIRAEYQATEDKADSYTLRSLMGLCSNELQDGRLEEARHVASLILEHAQRANLLLMEGWGHFWLGLVLYEWNDLDAVSSHFTAIIERRFTVPSHAARNAMIGMALVQSWQGAHESAFATLQLASQYDRHLLGDETDEVRASRAWLYAAQGNVTAALRWADSFTSPVPDRPLLWLVEPHLIKVRLLILRGESSDLEEALAILDALEAIAQKNHSVRFQIHLAIARARALDAQGHFDEAMVPLQLAVRLARQGGFTRAFLEHGPRIEKRVKRVNKKFSS